MDGKNLRPFVLLSVAVHLLLCFLYVNAVRARVPVLRPPVYTVSIVELQPEPEPEPEKEPEKEKVPDPEPPREEIKLPEPEPEPEKVPEKVPEKPRPKKKEPEKKPEPKKEQKKPEPKPVVEETPKRVTSSTGAVTVEAEDFPFAYYLALIESRIGGRWAPPSGLVGGGRRPKATVRFEIEKSGAIRSAHVSLSSGVPFFDTTALRAVTESGPFPPLPEGFPGERLGVNFVFTYDG